MSEAFVGTHGSGRVPYRYSGCPGGGPKTRSMFVAGPGKKLPSEQTFSSLSVTEPAKVMTGKDLSKYPRYEGYEQEGVRARNSDEVLPTKASDIKRYGQLA